MSPERQRVEKPRPRREPEPIEETRRKPTQEEIDELKELLDTAELEEEVREIIEEIVAEYEHTDHQWDYQVSHHYRYEGDGR